MHIYNEFMALNLGVKMKIKIIDNFTYQTYPISEDMIEVDENILNQIGKTKQFNVKTGEIIDYVNSINFELIELLNNKKNRLSELSKDLVQAQAGLIIPNIEDKKLEFISLLNEIRAIEGKSPRLTNNTN